MTSLELPANSITTATHQGHTLTLAMVQQLDRLELKNMNTLCRIKTEGKTWILGTSNKTGNLCRTEFEYTPAPYILPAQLKEPVTLCRFTRPGVESGDRYREAIFEAWNIRFLGGASTLCDQADHDSATRCQPDWHGQDDAIRSQLQEHLQHWKPNIDAASLPLVILH